MKEDDQDSGDRNHHRPTERISPIPIEFGQVKWRLFSVEVHAVNSGDKGEGNEDCRDDRQKLHHFIHPVADGRQIDIH